MKLTASTIFCPLLIIILIVHSSFDILGQDPRFSNILPNRVLHNPSLISAIENPRLMLFYRNQWPALSSAYINYGCSYAHPIEDLNSSFGALITNDAQGNGIFNTTSFNGLYSYTIRLNKEIKIYSGLQAGYTISRLNSNAVILESDIINDSNGGIISNRRNDFFDFSLGGAIHINNKIMAGLAVYHITSPINLKRKYIFFANYDIDLVKYVNKSEKILTPGILFSMQERTIDEGVANELVYGANIFIEPVTAGIWVRQNLPFHINAFLLTFGYSFKNYNIYYSYDLNLTGVNNFSFGMGAHEVTFLLILQYNEKNKKRKAIKCPKF